MSSAVPELNQANPAVYHLDLTDSAAGRQAMSAPDDSAWIDPLLQANEAWFCRLRWVVVGVLLSTGLIGLFPGWLRKAGLIVSPWYPLVCALVLAVLNITFIQFSRDGRRLRPHAVHLLLWAQIASDLLVLTAVIHWLGHSLSAAPFMYLFHVILACMVLPPTQSLGVAGLAAAFYLALLLLESVGVLSETNVVMHNASLPSLTTAPPAIGVISMLLVWGVIWYLVSRLASALRSRDRDLLLTNGRLRASIEERSQHMLQTTHQLKAPFAAIHAQCQLLMEGYCGTLPPSAQGTVEKISARCSVVARQIQEMLQLANLRSRGQTAPPCRQVNLEVLIDDVLSRVEPAARQRGVTFQREVQPVWIEAVEDHVTMIVDNLLLNAVNYSYANGTVTVTCRPAQPNQAVIMVRDHGIGIPREKLPRIFDDYYRTDEAVQHNRTSTGLGLAIVRQVARTDHVPITVESAPGWGTRFTVALPRHPRNTPSLNHN